MEDSKLKLLNETYDKIIDIGLVGNGVAEDLDDVIAKDFHGFGTTSDEIIRSINELYQLVKTQREQSEGLEFSWDFKPFDRRISKNGDFAVYSDIIHVGIIAGEEKVCFEIRFTAALEFLDNRWVLVHFHGSKPEKVESAEDTWGVQDWKRKNETLQKLVDERTAELNQSLEDLKQTQEQLIHSEKMASLGELTAGIAHEIQNPLNFVNNFSEINKELIEELKAEKALPDAERDSGMEEEILFDLYQNLEKIYLHGKRADNIVKGMLLHSRKSDGKKQLTDVNALADEYLRLAYHGLRAKDKTFNATLNTDFDESVGKVNVMPQELGRVILNLINNAFYACAERSRSACAERSGLAIQDKEKSGLESYMPTIWVSSKKTTSTTGAEELEISIRDNGNGIAEDVQQKIFQPFFTTKPSGKGTGLGLSLSYEIVKAHGGMLHLSSEAGIGTEFVIKLPITKTSN
ncbi:His Kinase A (phospho-acceptor) domain-containing protein [Flavobacteriaceae bacterium MAR_2010_188]|nr:His Kinase A (phospho-acceptor) domain-containing protein [Flavobacteriaceae bacterium MAR_2010_188]